MDSSDYKPPGRIYTLLPQELNRSHRDAGGGGNLKDASEDFIRPVLTYQRTSSKTKNLIKNSVMRLTENQHGGLHCDEADCTGTLRSRSGEGATIDRNYAA